MTRSLSTVHTRKGVSSTLRPYPSHIAKQIFLQFLRGGWGKSSVITWNFSPETRQVLNGIHPTILTPLKSNLIGGGRRIKYDERRNRREKKFFFWEIIRTIVETFQTRSKKLKRKGSLIRVQFPRQFPWNSLEFLNKTSKQHLHRRKEVKKGRSKETISGRDICFTDK